MDGLHLVEVEPYTKISDRGAFVCRAQHNDHTMGEMEPVDTFNLTLRGYQKQALLWANKVGSQNSA